MSKKKAPARKPAVKKAKNKAGHVKERGTGFGSGRHAVHPRTKPKTWIKWVLAARDMMLGATRDEAAAALGITVRNLGYWKAHPAWPDAEAEAESLCVRGIKHKAMRVLDSHFTTRGSPVLALDLLKSTSKEFQPVSKHEVSGKDGKPIQHETKVTFYIPENGR